MRVVIQKSVLLLLATSLLVACGGGGSEEKVAETPVQQQPQPVTSSEINLQNVAPVPQLVSQKVAGRVLGVSDIVEVGALNATGGFRAPANNTSFNGNLSASIAVEDQDGISRVFLTFDARDNVLNLCQTNCGLSFSTVVVGLNPASLGLSAGQHNLEVWVEDTSGNVQLVDSVAVNWNPPVITGVVAQIDQQQGSVTVSWSGIGSALRYNLYIANESGVTPQNYSSLDGGQARLALTQTSVTLADIVGTENFFILISGVDGSGESAFSEEIQLINDLSALIPEVNTDSVIVEEDGNGTFDLILNDDPHDDEYLVSILTQPQNGVAEVSEQGVLSYAPNEHYFGTDELTYQVENSLELIGEGTVTIEVTPVNDAPVANEDVFIIEDGEQSLTVPAPGVINNDLELDGQEAKSALQAEIVTTTLAGTIFLNPDGGFVYTASESFAGYDEFTYQIVDSAGETSSALAKIQAPGVNGYPPVTAADLYTVEEDELLQIGADTGILANDFDQDDALALLQLAIVAPPSNGELTLSADGSFNYNPEKDFAGEDLFTYSLTDPNGNASQADVTITISQVNDAPVSLSDTYAVDGSGTFSVTPAEGVLANDRDVEDDELQVASDSLTPPSFGAFEIQPDGAFTYTPSASFSGTDSFSYRATDGILLGNTVTVQLQVPDIRFTTGNDVELQIYSQNQLPQGVTLVTSMFSASSGSVAVVDGVAMYSAATGYIGLALIKVNYSFNDDEVTEYFYIDVTAGNQAPEINLDTTSFTNAENQNSAIVSVTATDPENGILSYSLLGNDAGSFEITEEGVLTFASAPNFEQPADVNGDNVYSLIIQVTDDGNPELEDTASIEVTVTNVNESPKITSVAPDSALEDVLYTYVPIVVDEDDENNGTDLTWALSNGPDGMTLSATGVVRWQPPINTDETYSFSLTVSDGGEDGSTNDTENIVISLTGENDPPEIESHDVNVTKGQSFQFQWQDYASDEEQDIITFDGFGVLPVNGTVSESGGTITYTHNDGVSTSDNFSYYVKSNGTRSLAPGLVSITVIEGNSPPNINSPTTLSLNENTAASTVVYTATTVTDPEGDAVTWSITDDAQDIFSINNQGQLSIANNTNLNYESLQQYAITIQAEDVLGIADTHNITVTILNVDEPPVISASISIGVNENHQTGTSAGLVATAVDPEGDAYSIELVDSNGVLTACPALFSLTESPTGTFTLYVDNTINFEDLVASYSSYDEDSSSNSYTYTMKLKATQTSNASIYTEQDLKVVINDVVESTELVMRPAFDDDGYLFYNPYTDVNNNEYLVDAKIDRNNNTYALIKTKNSTNNDEFVVAKYNSGVLDKNFGFNGIKQIFSYFQNDPNVEQFSNGSSPDDITAYKLIVHDDSTSSHDGKIYIVGSETTSSTTKPLVIRLNADGHLDKTFDTDGKFNNSSLTNVTGVDLLVHSNDKLYFAMNTLSAGSSTFYVEGIDADTGASLGSHGTYDFTSSGYDNFGKVLLENSLGNLVAIGYLDSSGDKQVFAARLSSTISDISSSVITANVEFDIKDISESNTSSQDVINGAIKIDASNAILFGSTDYKSNTHQDAMVLKLNIDTLSLYGDSDTECTTNNNCFGSEDANSDTKPDGVSIVNMSAGNNDEFISAALNNSGDISFIAKAQDSTKYPLTSYQVNSVGIATSAASTMQGQELAEKVGGSGGGVSDSNLHGVILHDVNDTNNNIHIISAKEVENPQGSEIETWITQYDNTGSSDLNGDTVVNDVAVIQDHTASTVHEFDILQEPTNDDTTNQYFYGFAQTDNSASIYGAVISRFLKQSGATDTSFNGNSSVYEWQPDSTNNKSYEIGGMVILQDQSVVTTIVENDYGTYKLIVVRRNADGTAYTDTDLPSGQVEFSKPNAVSGRKLVYDESNSRLYVIGEDAQYADSGKTQTLVIGIDLTDWSTLFHVNIDVLNNDDNNLPYDAELLSDGSLVIVGGARVGSYDQAFAIKLELDNDGNSSDNILGLNGVIGDLEVNDAFDANSGDSDRAIAFDLTGGMDNTLMKEIEVTSDNSIILVAYDNYDIADFIFKYSPNGSLEYVVDTSFNDEYESTHSVSDSSGAIKVKLPLLSSSGTTGAGLVFDMKVVNNNLWFTGLSEFGEKSYAFVAKLNASTGNADDTFGRFGNQPGFFVPYARQDCTSVPETYQSLCNIVRFSSIHITSSGRVYVAGTFPSIDGKADVFIIKFSESQNDTDPAYTINDGA